MKHKGVLPLLLASVVLGLALGWRLNCVETGGAADRRTDARGALCVLTAEKDGAKLLRFSTGGVLIGEKQLENADGGAKIEYAALAADGLGNLYVLARTVKKLGGGEALVLSETVRMYDANLVRGRDALTLDHGGGSEAAIRKLEAVDGTVLAVCAADGRIEALAADAAAGGAPHSVLSAVLPQKAVIYDAAATADGKLLYTTTKGGLFAVEAGEIRDLSAALGRNAVPAAFFLDENGQICFQERVSGAFYCFDGKKLAEIPAPERDFDQNTLRGPLFPDFALRAAICTLITGLILSALRGLFCLLRREKELLPRLLLRLFFLCAALALALTLTLAALGLGPTRRQLGKALTDAAGEAASVLAGAGLGNTDLLAVRGAETEAALAARLARSAEKWEEKTGLSCTFTLYDSRRQRWFRTLSGAGGESFTPVEDGALSAACGAALGGEAVTLEERRADAVSVLLTVPTGENPAVLEVRAGWNATLGAAVGRSLWRGGLCALAFAAALWLGGALILSRGLRPLKAPRPDPDGGGPDGRRAPRGGADAGASASRRELGELMDGELCTRTLCTLYAVFDEERREFARLQARLDRLCAAVRKNGGCVAACTAGTLTALFPGGGWDAARTAVELRESLRAEGAAEPRIVVDAGPVTLGPAGGTLLAVSGGLSRGAALTGAMEARGLCVLITQAALDAVEPGRSLCLRYVGSGTGRLYELLEGLTYHEKKLRQSTCARFEAGVAAFEAGERERARACFAAVAGIDRGDRTALYYLARCGEGSGGEWNTIF